MIDINDRKRNYGIAQQLGEDVERLESSKGWAKVVVPEFTKKRDEAQEAVNNVNTDLREADFQRGVLDACNALLNLPNVKKDASKSNMASNRG